MLVDDTRTFRDGREHLRARTSREALAVLRDLGVGITGQLWLDHDLGVVDGCTDSTLPVLDELARAACVDRPYGFREVLVHTANPVGAATLMQVLRRWGYPCRRVGCAEHLVDESAPSDRQGTLR